MPRVSPGASDPAAPEADGHGDPNRTATSLLRDVRVAVAAGLLVLAIALVIVLSQSPVALTGTNGVEAGEPAFASVPGAGHGCQGNETLPANTTAIRLSLSASSGPRVAVTVSSGGTVLAHGRSSSGWTGRAVTVPVAPLDRTVDHATVCFSFPGADEQVSFLGASAAPRAGTTVGTHVLPGRLAVEYLRSGSSSWFSQISEVARRMGLGRAWAGTWVALLVAMLMASAGALAVWLTIRESR
jgi:hypothetical protein